MLRNFQKNLKDSRNDKYKNGYSADILNSLRMLSQMTLLNMNDSEQSQSSLITFAASSALAPFSKPNKRMSLSQVDLSFDSKKSSTTIIYRFLNPAPRPMLEPLTNTLNDPYKLHNVLFLLTSAITLIHKAIIKQQQKQIDEFSKEAKNKLDEMKCLLESHKNITNFATKKNNENKTPLDCLMYEISDHKIDLRVADSVNDTFNDIVYFPTVLLQLCLSYLISFTEECMFNALQALSLYGVTIEEEQYLLLERHGYHSSVLKDNIASLKTCLFPPEKHIREETDMDEENLNPCYGRRF